MSSVTSDAKLVEPKKTALSQPQEAGSSDIIPQTNEFYSPIMGVQMTSADNFDFQENELGSTLMNSTSSGVYSPFFWQPPYPEKSAGESKLYSSSFGDEKGAGMEASIFL